MKRRALLAVPPIWQRQVVYKAKWCDRASSILDSTSSQRSSMSESLVVDRQYKFASVDFSTKAE